MGRRVSVEKGKEGGFLRGVREGRGEREAERR